jgi:hypothetical protein
VQGTPQSVQEIQEGGGLALDGDLHDQLPGGIQHRDTDGRQVNVQTDILDVIHRVLLCAVGSVGATTKPTLPSKGRPFIMRGFVIEGKNPASQEN